MVSRLGSLIWHNREKLNRGRQGPFGLTADSMCPNLIGLYPVGPCALLSILAYIYLHYWNEFKSNWQFSLWSTMLVMFLVEVLLPIPFSFAIASSALIGILYLIIETSLYFGKSLVVPKRCQNDLCVQVKSRGKLHAQTFSSSQPPASEAYVSVTRARLVSERHSWRRENVSKHESKLQRRTRVKNAYYSPFCRVTSPFKWKMILTPKQNRSNFIRFIYSGTITSGESVNSRRFLMRLLYSNKLGNGH